MDKKKLEYFRKRLETRQKELRHMVTRNQQDGRSADDEATQDIADRAASSYNKEFLFSQSNNDRQLLQMVDGALARLREGSFGECVSCGKEIDAKRLEAVPWTRHCIECQECGADTVRRTCCCSAHPCNFSRRAGFIVFGTLFVDTQSLKEKEPC